MSKKEICRSRNEAAYEPNEYPQLAQKVNIFFKDQAVQKAMQDLTYNIGRFPKSSTDFRTVDHRKEGLIWYGNWKTFWSYQHPRVWTDLTSQEIVDDILGLSN